MPLSLRPVSLRSLPPSDNLLQSSFWGEVKSGFGHTPYAFRIEGGGTARPLLVLVRRFAPGMSLAYVPHGPENVLSVDPFEQPEDPSRYLSEITEKLAPVLPGECVFIRYDLPWTLDGPEEVSYSGKMKKAAMDIQPPSTVILDISDSEDDILGRMKSKTRYNIRLSDKKGVRIVEGGPEHLPLWYDLYRETARRDKIAIHSFEYYKAPFTAAEGERGPEVKLFLAYIGDVCAAGIIAAAYGRQATYLYGASSGYKRNFMPAYGLQWEAIRWAKKRGCERYDLFGIPPENDPSHPMHGLYRFKTGFGGKIVHRPGAWDVPLKPLLFALSGRAERLRYFYYKKLKKR